MQRNQISQLIQMSSIGMSDTTAILFIINVIMVARTSSTHCDTLRANGTYDRKGCE